MNAYKITISKPDNENPIRELLMIGNLPDYLILGSAWDEDDRLFTKRNWLTYGDDYFIIDSPLTEDEKDKIKEKGFIFTEEDTNYNGSVFDKILLLEDGMNNIDEAEWADNEWDDLPDVLMQLLFEMTCFEQNNPDYEDCYLKYMTYLKEQGYVLPLTELEKVNVDKATDKTIIAFLTYATRGGNRKDKLKSFIDSGLMRRLMARLRETTEESEIVW